MRSFSAWPTAVESWAWRICSVSHAAVFADDAVAGGDDECVDRAVRLHAVLRLESNVEAMTVPLIFEENFIKITRIIDFCRINWN